MIVAAGQVYFRDLKNFLPYVAADLAVRVADPLLRRRGARRYKLLLVVNPLGALLDRVERRARPRARARPGRSSLGAGWAFGAVHRRRLFFISREREFAVRL